MAQDGIRTHPFKIDCLRRRSQADDDLEACYNLKVSSHVVNGFENTGAWSSCLINNLKSSARIPEAFYCQRQVQIWWRLYAVKCLSSSLIEQL